MINALIAGLLVRPIRRSWPKVPPFLVGSTGNEDLANLSTYFFNIKPTTLNVPGTFSKKAFK